MFEFPLEDPDQRETQLNGKMVTQIVNPQLKQMITDHLFRVYNIRMSCTNKYFREFDATSDINLLKKYKHLTYVNTHHRIDLLALVTFVHQKVCMLIDKQQPAFYVLKCQLSPNLYQGTVFEGEQIDDIFLISDFLVYMGKDISHHPLDRRVKLLNSIIAPKHYHYDALLDPFQLTVKDFVEYHELCSYVEEYLPTLSYHEKVSGLIFRPIENSNKNLLYNFNHRYLNNTLTSLGLPKTGTDSLQRLQIDHNKYPEVTFLLFETGNPDDYCLKLYDSDPDGSEPTQTSEESEPISGRLVIYDYAVVNDMKTSHFLQATLNTLPGNVKSHGIAMVCRYLETFQKWKPIRLSDTSKPGVLSNLI